MIAPHDPRPGRHAAQRGPDSRLLWYPPWAREAASLEPAAGDEPAGTDDPAVASAAPAAAVIGDELRQPAAWCDFGACISRFTDPAALGERDLRARAIAAGWLFDALGRLACPRCQQNDASFWTTRPLRPWPEDRWSEGPRGGM